LVLLLPVDEIGKRAPHSLEHASRFLLCPMKRVLDLPFDAAERAAFLVGVIIVLYIFHRRTSKHPFSSLHRAPSRADINRAHRARRSISQRNDPDRFASLV